MRTLDEQISATKREMQAVKPRSRRSVQLEIRLRDLRLKQIGRELRISKRRRA